MPVLIVAVILGMLYAYSRGLDDAQTFIVCLFAWLCLQSIRYCIYALAPRYRGRR